MSSSVSSTPSRPHNTLRRGPRYRSLSQIAARRGTLTRGATLADYLDADGRDRELLALPGNGGSVLVLDRDATTLCDRRLVAHLAPDEPVENAALICHHYLQDTRGRWCRRVVADDLEAIPFALGEHQTLVSPGAPDTRVEDACGNVYQLVPLLGGGSSAQLRWSRRDGRTDNYSWEQVKLRDVVAAFESYEPVRTFTEQAIAHHRDDPHVLSARLCSEFERLCTSPIVLNRGLREAVLEATKRRGMTMSEIALRCGTVKRDRHGKPSGETSWLARRVGLMPEGGAQAITPWIHSDVLAAIARKGLGLGPREVELQ